MSRKWMIVAVLALGALGVAASPGAAGAHDDGPSELGEPGPDAAPAAEGLTEGPSERPSESSAGGGTYKARLSGLNEFDATTSKTGAGALGGSGRATVHVRDGGRVCWSIRVDGIGAAVAAHIHKGAIGANGPVVVDFEAAFKGCKPLDPGLARAIAASPEDYYVNVHTADFKAGAIRGQLRVEPDEIELKARLSGANEVTSTGQRNAGDPDGRGKLDVDLRGTLLCWKFSATGLDPVVAQHIHKGSAGANGPVVVDFDGQSRGCRDITEALSADIAASPASYYGNMHTGPFPTGAVRGQLASS